MACSVGMGEKCQFFLAMVRWQVGDKEQARSWYEKAVRWMDRNMPQSADLRRFRAEAAQLLGIGEATAPAAGPPPPQAKP